MHQSIGQIERKTQSRVVRLFQERLKYKYLGNWEDRAVNSNVEQELVIQYLNKCGYPQVLITRALDQLTSAANNYEKSLYHNNKEVYRLLRYGAQVKADVGENTQTVHFINWSEPLKNEFYIAEEVTIKGQHDKRPDIVLYVNGIALGVLELKRSTADISEGIHQSLTNQRKEFIESFFTTIQFIFAGNDTQGLMYGTINTPAKYYLKWKEDEKQNTEYKVDKYLLKLCDKRRLLEIIYDFIVYDGGIKKLPRPHQYFGVKLAQQHVRDREGGIIWHTQGSGKSLVMVILARWILENNPNARVAIITDREELDAQIERVFTDTGTEIYRTKSGRDLINQLNQTKPRLLCSLVHKFGKKGVDDFDRFIEELRATPSTAVGELFVFVDECHRTQSGKLHKTMKALLPDAVFIGFTGTPLLKKDKATSLEVFGKYIHTYKFNEAVEDEVVLDLIYEARDIDQRLGSPEKVDQWFEAKTKGLNDFQKSELKKRWGTMQKVLSSRSRMSKIVADVLFDFSVKPRLSSDAGNAILVASSIYEACRYYELFENTPLKERVGIITSYNPSIKDIRLEEVGANTETEKQFIYNTYMRLLSGKATDAYEEEAKAKFVKEPANMKLLIVVDKLLTGFDAPSCTYLYIDKSMQDHGLFQAICRVNRLDGEDKPFGYIVDYKDLFTKVEDAVSVYTSELDYDEFKKEECEILLKDRLNAGRERLEEAMNALDLLCEPVPHPKEPFDYQRYFCGNPEIEEEIQATAFLRNQLYKHIVAFIRAYSNIADEMPEAGYSPSAIDYIKGKMDFYLNLREEIRRASGETLDLKAYEADMRHLIDNYIQADDSRVISPFGDMSLLDIIVKTGIAEGIDSLPEGTRKTKEAVAEAIENNVRQKIIRDHLLDPAFFDEMSKLLTAIIHERKSGAIAYEEYLKKIADLVNTVAAGKTEDTPDSLNTPALRALYNNLDKDETKAILCDQAIRASRKDDWKGNLQKELEVKAALYTVLNDVQEVERIFPIIKEQSDY